MISIDFVRPDWIGFPDLVYPLLKSALFLRFCGEFLMLLLGYLLSGGSEFFLMFGFVTFRHPVLPGISPILPAGSILDGRRAICRANGLGRIIQIPANERAASAAHASGHSANCETIFAIFPIGLS